jgi:HEAT repeats
MQRKQILERFSRACPHADKAAEVVLQHAADAFVAHPRAATSIFRRLQTGDAAGFTQAALHLLAGAEEKSPGLKHLFNLLFNGNLLIDLLLDHRILTAEAAIPLAHQLATAQPRLEVRIMERLFQGVAGDVRKADKKRVLRALELVAAVSDCSRVASHLVQCLRHSNDHVCSKAVLLLGRSNFNLARIDGFLAADDARVSANAVESLRGCRQAGVRETLWKAARHPHGRVAVNALLELSRWGDREAYVKLAKLSESPDPVLRSGAAWAMGESGDPEFSETLEKLRQDDDAKVKAIAEKSLAKLSAVPASDR